MFYKSFLCYLLLISCLFSTEHVYLGTPAITQENIIGTNVGIRPFRKTGVRLEAETLGGKLLVHNYGYGGSGLTLAFGGAQEVIDILNNHPEHSKTVAVLGAGVAGLATAYMLQENGYKVHIYADEWSPNLTSNVAAGIWTPLIFPPGLDEEKKLLHQRMLENSRKRFLKSTAHPPEFSGVRIAPEYSFKTPASQKPEPANDHEEIIAHFDNGVTAIGRRSHQIFIDGHLFMNDLSQKVEKNGATAKQFHFNSAEDILNLNESTIINCTSMGSIALFHDEEFIPVRGELIYFKPQKNIDYIYSHNVDRTAEDPNLFFVVICPWSDRLILGGVYEFDQTAPVADPKIIKTIFENAEKSLSRPQNIELKK